MVADRLADLDVDRVLDSAIAAVDQGGWVQGPNRAVVA